MPGAFVLAILLTAASVCHGEDDAASKEKKVKAAFLYNFARLVDWPPGAFKNARAPFVIAVVDTNAFREKHFRALLKAEVRGRPVVVKQFDPSEPLDCHILYVNTEDKALMRRAMLTAKTKPVLTVGESKIFAEMGGMLNFVRRGANVKFSINLEEAQRQDLRLSSYLLQLAVPEEEDD